MEEGARVLAGAGEEDVGQEQERQEVNSYACGLGSERVSFAGSGHTNLVLAELHAQIGE